MRASYRSHPVLKMLENETLEIIGLSEKDIIINRELIDFMKNMFSGFSKTYFKKNIYYLENTFDLACKSAFESMIKDDIWNDIGEFYGTILSSKLLFGLDAMVWIKQTDKLSLTSDIKTHDFVIYLLRGDVFYGFITCFSIIDKSFCLFSNEVYPMFENVLKKVEMVTGKKIPEKYLTDKELIIGEFRDYIHTAIVAIINFIRYADVQTVLLDPNKKIKEFNCKYRNDTLSNITILNSTWFTNFVKSDAFKVRGHFRLHPYGHGLMNRKLIWINEFMKTGYTAPARKLTHL